MSSSACVTEHPLACSLTSDDRKLWPRSVTVWLPVFMTLGVVLRLVRYSLVYPLWRDEAYLAANILLRDFAGLSRPLDYQQVCPLLFLWAEKAIVRAIGFSECTLRVLPTLASVGSLFLMRQVSGRVLTGFAWVSAVAILAIGYTPIRHGGEVKPYATDLLVALGLLALAVEWLRTPSRPRFLWVLAALGPFAIAISNPAIFVVASVGLSLVRPVIKTRRWVSIVPFVCFVAGSVATFVALLDCVNAPQSDSVMEWMRVYWRGSFPPRAPLALIAWLARVHTGYTFAYPAGGDMGASVLTTGLVIVGIVALVRRGASSLLWLLLTPFALGLIAAFFGRYPYGGSARVMQYVAPSIIMLAAVGLDSIIAKIPGTTARGRARAIVLCGFFATGLGMLVWDVGHPYKEPMDAVSRDFARRFWAEESAGAELFCARTDLKLPLNRRTWEGDRAALYLCHQEMYARKRHAPGLLSLDRISERHPLRIVVFGETRRDAAMMCRWIKQSEPRLRLRSRHERALNKGVRRGKGSAEERYVVYELAPAGPLHEGEVR